MKNHFIMTTAFLSLAVALLAQCGSPSANKKNPQIQHNADTQQITQQQKLSTAYKEAPRSSSYTDDSVSITYYNETEDKARIGQIVNKYAQHTANPDLIIAIARELRGIPYVAKTLEVNKQEKLVINLSQLDCTTYVENVLAIYLCIKNGKTAFDDYAHYLRMVRYQNGEVSYPARQHYFTDWIYENTQKGFVQEIQSPNPPFTAIQALRIDFMSTHASLYPMLKNNPQMIERIAKTEQLLSGKKFSYIPKSAIHNTKLLRSSIHDGDIIAITTSKAGLDTSHIGIAVWHKDGLHMLNASQIHKKVVEEPMTLYQYMQKHPSQTGIRIVRIK